ncbi:hypothetical protein RR46_00904 [Papilio xuthus]|uniref:Uncharacterized protein n=1 Tax=Papilio xuthus TaxID=66420 RepID=A0A0N0P9V5_PAPXU|nr:hypothetical protein RR46_00904 [Papilio xuthus]
MGVCIRPGARSTRGRHRTATHFTQLTNLTCQQNITHASTDTLYTCIPHVQRGRRYPDHVSHRHPARAHIEHFGTDFPHLAVNGVDNVRQFREGIAL